MMKMIFLLVSAVALLFASANPINDTDGLNHIIDLKQHYNKTLHMGHFVEDVKEVVSNCVTDYSLFFCKVSQILSKHPQFGKTNVTAEVKIVKNLKNFIVKLNPTCAVLLENVKTANGTKPIPGLINDLADCIRVVNMRN